MRRIVVGVVAVGLALGVVTLAALEGREVVVLRTTDERGAPRRTRTWIAAGGGDLWVEAANPERPFLADLRRDPALVLERGGGERRCTAAVAPDPEGRERVRALLAARYGWADCWIGLVADTRRSVGVRLACS